MSVFEADAVRTQCINSLEPAKRKAADTEWKSSAETRVAGWKNSRKNQSNYPGQLEFVANIIEYVGFFAKLTCATTKGAAPLELNTRVPLLGPHFVPPSFSHVQRRQAVPHITPEIAYLKPVTVIHPVYYPELGACPQCGSTDIQWSGWAPTGPRDVHGVEREETAIGIQLRCNPCKEMHSKGGGSKSKEDESSYCFATTNCQFWEKREHWDIPLGIPQFLKKSALTRDLFNLVVEFRPSGTAAGIAEHVRQLHLLEYHKLRLVYLRAHAARSRQTSVKPPPPLQIFADPMTSGKHNAGYDCRSISDELVSEVFNRWVEKTRQSESEELMRTLTAITISLDATFRSAGKATIADKDKARTKLWTGGLQSVLNEKGQTMSWGWCHSLAHAEIEELLDGIRRRLELLDVASPEIAVVDNCCHVKAVIRKVFPDIDVVLDVWHFVMRYAACILGGMKSPYRAAVMRDITDAILKTTASNGNPAIYRSQDEQERRLVEAYTRWADKGDVWSAAAEKVHADQLAHVNSDGGSGHRTGRKP
ncbi:hypothetical protein C8T65DRAFT_745002 [Cerioporus squamosus]|nr:hypothetical protein C8T65DRAFT_745002 [Cerioporus squamosus]